MHVFRMAVFALLLAALPGCGRTDSASGAQRTLVMSMGRLVTSLDPALASDTTSQYMVGAFYDTPLQYSYTERPYKLEPSMLESLPEPLDGMMAFKCVLREGLLFQDASCFKGLPPEARRVTASDMAFSILRLADARIKSGGFWLVRGRIKGVDAFREASAKLPPGDLSIYDKGVEGIEVLDGHTFIIRLNAPDPRFPYALAMPYFSAVSRRAAEFYGASFGDNPAGSGPFILEKWVKDYSITFVRNPDYRPETFPGASAQSDRMRRLPLLDRVVCYLVKQPLASWLMFLQGELDFCALDGDNFDAVVDADMNLVPALAKRGVELLRAPQLETNYIGFNMADPVLGGNLKLRQALSLAFDRKMRESQSNGRLQPAYGPVPPGSPGQLSKEDAPFGAMDLERAKALLAEAGYPGGIDPKTGKPLELNFDQAGSETFFRQTAEMLATDFRRIGVEVKPQFNNRPRFIQKLSQGQAQLFRFSWTGDYPDPENFLQLFYGPNAGTCNRVNYRDPAFDALYKGMLPLPDSPERDAKCREMSLLLARSCPWIFESHPVSFMLVHRWTGNYIPHDFGFNRWKYLSVDPVLRDTARKAFAPISMDELRK